MPSHWQSTHIVLLSWHRPLDKETFVWCVVDDDDESDDDESDDDESDDDDDDDDDEDSSEGLCFTNYCSL